MKITTETAIVITSVAAAAEAIANTITVAGTKTQRIATITAITTIK